MPTVEERVAYLEGRVEDQLGATSELRTDVRELRAELREFRSETTGQFGVVRGEMGSQFHGLRDDMSRFASLPNRAA